MTRWLTLGGVLMLMSGCAPFMAKSEWPKAHIMCATWPIVYVGDVKDCPPNRHPVESDAHVNTYNDEQYTELAHRGVIIMDSLWHQPPDGVCETAIQNYIQSISLAEYREQRKPPFPLTEMAQLCDAYVWPWGQPSWR